MIKKGSNVVSFNRKAALTDASGNPLFPSASHNQDVLGQAEVAPEVSNPTGLPQASDLFETPYPCVIGDNVLVLIDNIELDSRTASGLFMNAGQRKEFFSIKAIGSGVVNPPYEVGDMVEAYSKNYTYFTAYDGLKYVITPSSDICGYYKKKA